MIVKIQSSQYVEMSATGAIVGAKGILVGFMVASSSSGTVKLWDSLTAANTVLLNTMNVVANTFYPMANVAFNTGLFLTLGGSADITFFIQPQ